MSKKHSEIHKRSPRSSSSDYQENSKSKYGKTESDQYRERSRSPVGREKEFSSLRKVPNAPRSNAPRIRDEESRFKPSQASSKRSSNTERSWADKYSRSTRDIDSDTPPPPSISDDPLHRVTADLVPSPPPPPRISKITMGFSKAASVKLQPPAIKMNISAPKVQAPAPAKVKVASVFNDDSDDEEPEEMPPEARMRMRNIGRETPTSAGPNSFGKTKHGFCDSKKVFERNLKQALESSDPKQPSKFPQTVYKINNS